MKIAILDGYTSTMGELDWKGFEAFGEVAVYDRTPKDKLSSAQGARKSSSPTRFQCSGSRSEPFPNCAI